MRAPVRLASPSMLSAPKKVIFAVAIALLLIEARRSRAGEMEDPVELAPIGLAHVVTDHLEVGVLQEVRDVLLSPGEIIVEPDDVVAPRRSSASQTCEPRNRPRR